MIFSQVKDLKIRIKYKKIEKIRNLKKFIITNLLSSSIKNYDTDKKRIRFLFSISKLQSKNLSKVKIVRRCILTNRGRGIIRPYHFSNSIFRNLNQFGLIPGYRKAVW